jgi:Tfp pilus assembly protein PilE/DNA-directed RNA polymerase subunit RPC12/RpoP
MALVSCPDCGAQVSDTAVVCPQCGFPIRPVVLERPTRFTGARRSSANGLVVGLVAVGIVVLVVLGVLAALAIPRFAKATASAKEREGVGLLKQVYTLESTYASNHGVYAPTLEALKSVGWAEPEGTRYYTVQIASATLSDLCLNAVPRPGSGVRPIRMRTLGEIDYGARCGELDPNLDLNADATAALRDVYRGINAWRWEHKRLPETEADLMAAYPSAATDPDFIVGLTPVPTGGICVHIAPRTTRPSPVALSMDIGGNVYSGDGCSGPTVDRF